MISQIKMMEESHKQNLLEKEQKYDQICKERDNLELNLNDLHKSQESKLIQSNNDANSKIKEYRNAYLAIEDENKTLNSQIFKFKEDIKNLQANITILNSN